jgi:hypothetical protein
MGFVHNDDKMKMSESESTHAAHMDFHLMGNDSVKINKNLKLPMCASISVHTVSYIEILRYGFCLEYGILSSRLEFFQNSKWFKSYGWTFNLNLPKLVKNPDLGICSKNWQICF